MRALLLHPDRDFDLDPPLRPNRRDLAEDLELDTLLDGMARGDAFLREVARTALLAARELDVATIRHRQDVLRDCVQHPDVVRRLYALAVETIARRRQQYFGFFSRYPGSLLHGSVELLHMFTEMLLELRRVADANAHGFQSAGFTKLFTTLQQELGDAYLAEVRDHLGRLQLRSGVLVSADLGQRNQGTNHVLRQPLEDDRHWWQRLFGQGPPGYTIRIDPRDEAGARALGELRDRGIDPVANAAAQAAEHLLGFFEMLKTELAFYVACLNLRETLSAMDAPTCLPESAVAGTHTLRFTELYDVCLALRLGRKPVGNSLSANGIQLVIVTGANQGGKSTFLRSIGVAQLMMQCGMFVGAGSFAGELCTGVFTHYKREEDASMRKGKLDEELSRMSALAGMIGPHSLVLFNESFAATNEREGSEIARQVVRALREKAVKLFFVTHLYEFAHSIALLDLPDALFLRAERLLDGTRTFRIEPGPPQQTSYGQDVYAAVFAATQRASEPGEDVDAADSAPRASNFQSTRAC